MERGLELADGLNLRSYSSGDGALHFVVADYRGIAKRPPTDEEAQRFLTDCEDGRHLAGKGWKLVKLHNTNLLVFPVTRVDDDHLRCTLYSDHVYRYQAHKEQNGEVRDYSLRLYTETSRGEHDVPNLSLRMVIRYFLSHEAELTPIFTGAKGNTEA